MANTDHNEADIEFPQPVCIEEKPHARHRIIGTWRTECPGRTTREAQHAAAQVPAHVRNDCPALPVGCVRCTAPATVRAALAASERAPSYDGPVAAKQATASPMSCPRGCGVDIRDHHSSDEVKGGCDTGPLSVQDMRTWFEARGAGQPGFCTVAELIEEHYGKTEDELDKMYDAMHGSMA
jgi:hypothetical protein